MFRYALGLLCVLWVAGCEDPEEPGWICSMNFEYDRVSDRCVCIEGYALHENRCVLKTELCDSSLGLVYSDEKSECVCLDGFALKDGYCQNIDECAEGTAQCGAHGQCQDAVVSTRSAAKYNCICDEGFQEKILDSGEVTCVDIDECDENYRICGAHGTCQNLEGSYRCECDDKTTELSSDGKSCVDINECDLGRDSCGAHGVCRNHDITDSSYGYGCDCDEGFQEKILASGEVTCVDIDECAKNHLICGDHGTCQNLEGDYLCECDDKTALSSDGKSCVDINECDLGRDFCGAHGICRNYDINDIATGSYAYRCDCDFANNYKEEVRLDGLLTCQHMDCRMGTEKREVGGECVDIDECEQNMHACGEHGRCQNSDYVHESDKYRCICDEGYEEHFIGEGEYRCDPVR